MLGTVQDVTGLAQTRQRLEQANRQNEALLNSAADGIYGLDLEGRFTFANPAAVALTGHTVEADARPAATTSWSITRARTAPRIRPRTARAAASSSSGVALTVCDEVFWRSDGTSFPVEYTHDPDHRGRHAHGSAGRLPRHHRAPPDRERARATQYGARRAGTPRSAHRAREPTAPRGGARALRRAPSPLRPLLLRAALRPRSLQGTQRPRRPPGRRPRPARGRRHALPREPHHRCRLPLRRRGAPRAARRADARGGADRLRADARGRSRRSGSRTPTTRPGS